MKPAPFLYHRATSARDAAERLMLSDDATSACILAGGQSLVPALSTRERRPGLVIDIMACEELRRIGVSDQRLRIGAGCRQADVEHSPVAREACPLVREALGWVAVPQVRTRGTVVGAIVQANAGGEMPVVAVALGADVLTTDQDGSVSRLAARDLYDCPSGTTLPPRTLVTGIEFPILGADDGWAFEELQLRRGHFAIVCAAAVVTIRSGKVASARIAVGGLTANPYRALRAEALLVESSTDRLQETLHAAANLAADERPWPSRTDLHATSQYREAVTRTVVRKALKRALACSSSGTMQ